MRCPTTSRSPEPHPLTPSHSRALPRWRSEKPTTAFGLTSQVRPRRRFKTHTSLLPSHVEGPKRTLILLYWKTIGAGLHLHKLILRFHWNDSFSFRKSILSIPFLHFFFGVLIFCESVLFERILFYHDLHMQVYELLEIDLDVLQNIWYKGQRSLHCKSLQISYIKTNKDATSSI